MTAVLLDTSAYSAFKRGNYAMREIIRQSDRLWIPSVVLGELMAGFEYGSRTEQNRNELAQFLSSPRTDTVAVDEESAERYAIIYRFLREAGRPIPTNDLWIAALAMQHGLPLVTADRHFEYVPQIMCRFLDKDIV